VEGSYSPLPCAFDLGRRLKDDEVRLLLEVLILDP